MLDLEKYGISKNETLLIGVSGGPDSMALLDMLVKSGYKVIVATVNYHKRETANRDEKIVKDYCFSNKLVVFSSDYDDSKSGNFQDLARNYRYNFFKSIYDRENCSALLIAHQLDDCLETYLFRKNRNSKAKSLTIEEIDSNYGMKIIRPLLSISKKELEEYCVKHSIEYGIDESNLTNHYSRNSIRMDIAKLSDEEKDSLIKEMNSKVNEWNIKKNNALALLSNNSFNYDSFKNLTNEEKHIILCEIIDANTNKLASNLTGGRLDNFIEALDSSRSMIQIKLEDNIYLLRSENKVYLYKDEPVKEEIITSLSQKSSLFKEIGEKMEGFYAFENDFPLTIRSFKETDVIEIKNGHKLVKKLLIEKKIPLIQRKNWIVVENKDHSIIYVNKYYRSVKCKNLHNNLFIV